MVKCLIEQGADLDAEDAGSTSLHVAALTGEIEIVKYLIEKGAFIGPKTDYNDQVPLHLAAEEGNIEIAQYLVIP